MVNKLATIAVKDFLTDFEQKANIEIIEGAKQKDEIVKIAKARGIDLKKNKDLLAFKCIYAFADRPNANLDYLPEEPLLKALPSIIGKPVNLRHDRRYVVGHIIDYRYQVKGKKVIAYGVVYASCFKDETRALKQDFSDKKLTVSFEIFSPPKKRKKRADGVTELYDMTMAGMALLPRDETPAFEGANVLTLAKKRMDEENNVDLVYASKYKTEDIITADIFKKEVEENLEKFNREQAEHEQPIEEPKVNKIKCSNCNKELNLLGIAEYKQGTIKCPECTAIINKQTGEMIYPPQIRNFRLSCPNCNGNDWLILSNKDNKSRLKCLNDQCNKTYEIEFAIDKPNEMLDKMKFVYINTISCIQCGSSISISTTSHSDKIEIKCPKCGLSFKHSIDKGNKDRKIVNITEIIEDEILEEGGEEEMKKKPDEKVEEEKVVDKKEVTEIKSEPKDESEAEDVNKPTEEKSDIKVSAAEENPVNSETPSNWIACEQDTVEGKESKSYVDIIKEENENPKEVTVEETKKPSAIRKAVKKILQLKKDNKKIKTEKETKEVKLKSAINKVASQLIKARAEIKKIKEEADKKIKFYEANAKEILKRREELGEDYAKDLSDEDILDEDKFKIAKLERENSLLKASTEVTDDIVGGKDSQNKDDLEKLHDEIDKKAFTKK